MKYWLTTIIVLLAGVVVWGQSIEELQQQLKEEQNSRMKSILNYQLAEAYYNSGKNSEDAEEYARRSHRIALDESNFGLAAESAYLLGRIQLKQRDKRNAEVWFRTSLDNAKKANDPDLIIKSVDQRSQIATRERNYRRAYQINQEAFEYFSGRGKSISALDRQYDISKAQLIKEKRALEEERSRLMSEVRNLIRERESLSSEKTELTERQKELLREKEQVEEQISAKEEILDSISVEKQAVEEIAKQKETQVRNLNRKALEQQAALDGARAELAEAELARKEAQLQAAQNRNLRNILLIASAFVIAVALLFFSLYRSKKKSSDVLAEKNKIIEKERQRSDELLLNILPNEIADELKEKGTATARKYNNVSVLFTDFKDFSKIAERLTPEQLVRELDYCFKGFDYIISQYNIEKIKTVGDAYMCATGLTKRHTLPTDIVKAALDIQEFLADYKNDRIRKGLPFFEARIGIHTGPVVAGVVGVNKFAYDIWGSTVNVAARMESNCEPGKINISGTTFGQVKYQFDCIPRGMIDAKNVGRIEMFYVLGSNGRT